MEDMPRVVYRHNGKMSRHVQFESNMSLSGANADKRVPVTPSQQKGGFGQVLWDTCLGWLLVGNCLNL